MVKLLIVDDHDLVRTGMSRILDDVEGFTVVGMASTVEQAITLSKQLSPDVLMIDVKMPGIGGLEATKRINLANDAIKIIAVTSCEDYLYPSNLLRAGASAYLTKKASPAELIQAVEKVVAGQIALKTASPVVGDDSPFEKLSDRELQIAMMTIRVEKPADIAKTLNISSKTINSFRYRTFEKFEISSDVELVLLAVKHKIFDVDTLE